MSKIKIVFRGFISTISVPTTCGGNFFPRYSKIKRISDIFFRKVYCLVPQACKSGKYYKSIMHVVKLGIVYTLF